MTEQAPFLEVIDELKYGVWKATVLKAALEPDLFTTIAKGHHTLKDIVAADRASRGFIRDFLPLCCTR